MVKAKWKIWLLLVLLAIIAAGGFYLLQKVGYISHIRVNKTKDGWVCSGPIQYDLMYPRNRPIVSNKNLVLLEKYHKRSLKQFLRHSYYITALTLPDGHIVYRTKISINGHPLQVLGIWPWQENVVVWGYYQEEPGLFNHISSITILNVRGKILKQFPITLPLKPMAVDEKNNLLLCQQKVDEKDFKQHLDPQILRMLELPSGTERFQVGISPFTDLAADPDGNVYINLLNERNNTWMNYAEKRVPYLSACVEKCSVLPWQKIWSVVITPVSGYPEQLKYEDGMLWYAVYDREGGPLVEDKRKWIGGPISCVTGEKMELQQRCVPYRIKACLDSKCYMVTKLDNELHVEIFSE